MVDPVTSGKMALSEPPNGSYVNTWDQPLQSNWITMDAALSGTTTVSLSNLDVLLVRPTYPTSANPSGVTNCIQNLRLLLTGTLSANVSVLIPSGVGGMWLVDNQTGGSAYTVTVKTSAGGSLGVTPPRGYITYVYSDGTNVGYADGGGIYALTSQFAFVPTGTVLPFAGTVGVPGYLYCDGLPYSRTTYANLFATIGTTWGAGDGSTTFNVPNFQNMFLRGVGTQGLGVEEADSFKSHTHTANVTDPGHNHQTALVAGSNTGYGRGTSISGIGGFSFLTDLSTLTQTKTTGVTVVNDATGSTETRPVNKRVYYIIKT